MIVAFYGQPGSGKTTLAKEVQRSFFLNLDVFHKPMTPPIVDGDDIREIFKNKDYSKEGRLRNLARISDIAVFLENKYGVVIVSAVFPFKEAREYLDSICEDVRWIYLPRVQDKAREKFEVKDFDIPTLDNEKHLTIETINKTIDYTTKLVMDFISQ